MAKKEYYFKNVDKTAKKATEHITAYLKSKGFFIIDVENNPFWQERDVDLLAMKSEDGKFPTTYKIEIKADTYYRTGNYFAESYSNLSKETPGCWFSTQSDFIFYYFIDERELHIIPTEEAQIWVRENSHNLKTRRTTTTGPKGEFWYQSEGFLVPRTKLQKAIDIDVKNI